MLMRENVTAIDVAQAIVSRNAHHQAFMHNLYVPRARKARHTIRVSATAAPGNPVRIVPKNGNVHPVALIVNIETAHKVNSMLRARTGSGHLSVQRGWGSLAWHVAFTCRLR